MNRLTSNLLTLPIGLALVAAGVLTTAQAAAAVAHRDQFAQAVANCQGNLPNSEGSLRKRPLAIANEGTTTAFVTCGFQDIDVAQTGTILVSVYVINNSAADVTVKCTLVDGILSPAHAPVTFFPKNETVAPGEGVLGVLTWSANGDNEAVNFATPSLTCALPGGTDLSLIRRVYPEDIGT